MGKPWRMWTQYEDAVIYRLIAADITMDTARAMLPERTKGALMDRACILRRNGRSGYQPLVAKPGTPVPPRPRGMTSAQIAWARENPGSLEAKMIIGWAAEGPVLL